MKAVLVLMICAALVESFSLSSHRQSLTAETSLEAQASELLKFNSAEHRDLGNAGFDAAIASLPLDHPLIRLNIEGSGYKVNEPNKWGLIAVVSATISFGTIVALSGDFFANSRRPISFGETFEDRQKRFMDSTERLYDEKIGVLIQDLSSYIHREEQLVKNAPNPEKAYNKQGDNLDKQASRIMKHLRAQPTGFRLGQLSLKGFFKATVNYFKDLGTKFVPYYDLVFFGGPYMRLAENNFDHFNAWARRTYAAGHYLAMKHAISCRNETLSAAGKKYCMHYAFFLEAYALHFFTDLYAGGHVRTPRATLNNLCSTDKMPLGGVLSKCMHDEDNTFGVAVQDSFGKKWTAYGDKKYFTKENTANREQATTAVKTSVLEIVDAYANGTLLDPLQFKAVRLLPDISHARADTTTWPLFIVDPKDRDKILYRPTPNPQVPVENGFKAYREINNNNWKRSCLAISLKCRMNTNGISKPAAEQELNGYTQKAEGNAYVSPISLKGKNSDLM